MLIIRSVRNFNSLQLLLLLSVTFQIIETTVVTARHHYHHRHTAKKSLTPVNGDSSSPPSSSFTRLQYQPEQSYCLSWRLAVEANNVKGWRTAPGQCLRHIEWYMVGSFGQYSRDLNFIVDSIYDYVDSVMPLVMNSGVDGKDAWVLDVDDTCISNLLYYKVYRRLGCEPYDPVGFREWAMSGQSPAVPPVLGLFNRLVDVGFKVFLVSGRDEEVLGDATVENLRREGFEGYERLILRSKEYRGQSAVVYKSTVRRKLEEEEGYRIWGNVGDQWSDLQGQSVGNRTFKLPNPMYFVP